MGSSSANDFMDSVKNSAQDGMNKFEDVANNLGNKMVDVGKDVVKDILDATTTVTSEVRNHNFWQVFWQAFNPNFTCLAPYYCLATGFYLRHSVKKRSISRWYIEWHVILHPLSVGTWKMRQMHFTSTLWRLKCHFPFLSQNSQNNSTLAAEIKACSPPCFLLFPMLAKSWRWLHKKFSSITVRFHSWFNSC